MPDISENQAAGFTEAELIYSVDSGAMPVDETFGPGRTESRRQGETEAHRMVIRDGRPRAGEFRLDEHGFEFVAHRTRVEDFFDADEVTSVYYAEIEELVKARTGAGRVLVFDHTLRAGNADTRAEKLVRGPVNVVHNDYTERSGPQRVRDLLPAAEAEELLQNRFAIVQVWRAIRVPIETDPLAIAEAPSLAAGDLIAAERKYPDRVGETYRIAFNPDHRWIYFPKMTRDEALVFKVYESETDGRARFTAHTAFDDPATPPGAPPRESIEMRTIAFF